MIGWTKCCLYYLAGLRNEFCVVFTKIITIFLFIFPINTSQEKWKSCINKKRPIHSSWSTSLFFTQKSAQEARSLSKIGSYVIIWNGFPLVLRAYLGKSSKSRCLDQKRGHTVGSRNSPRQQEFRAFSTRQAPRPPARSRDTNRTLSSKESKQWIS